VVAIERKDWAVAIERWEGVWERRLDEVAGYLGGAVALRETTRLDEAEALLREALGRFPDHRQVLVDLAHLRLRRRDFAGAVEILEKLRARYPNDVEAYIWGAVALRDLGQLEASEDLVRAGLELHPTHPHLLGERGMRSGRGDWSEALRRWEAARAAAPDVVELHIGRIGALKALRRFGEALSSLRELAERFPGPESGATM
jgi:tetratricopeptide (TPR) repeat protein